MGRLDWYKRDVNKALTGMANLSLEERGAYNTVLDLIYAHDGSVDDDDRYLAGFMRCDVRVWKRIRVRLIALEKLYVDGDQLRNKRADVVVTRALGTLASAADAGRSSAAKRNTKSRENNNLASTPVEQPFQPTRTRTQNKKEEGGGGRAGASLISDSARQLADKLTTIIGVPYDHPAWIGLAARIESWRGEGWADEDISAGVQVGMKTCSELPRSSRYFEPVIARAHAQRLAGVPAVVTGGFRERSNVSPLNAAFDRIIDHYRGPDEGVDGPASPSGAGERKAKLG